MLSTLRFPLWIAATEHIDPRFGGVCAILPHLAKSIAYSGRHRLCVAGFCESGERWSTAPDQVALLEKFPLSARRWLWDPRLRARLDRLISAADGVHIHGLWRSHCLLPAYTARKHHKPYLISAHGMLEKWALGNKYRKKQIYSFLFERRNLHKAACLHALTPAEASDYRSLGFRAPIAIIPNGVRPPQRRSAESFLDRFPELRKRRLVLFLGRIHFKKGLDILCRAWQEVSRRQPDSHLVFAGPDFENTRTSVEALARELGIENRVMFTGMLADELKWSALAAADLFVLPSYSEGFSVSVLEALAMGKPIIVTAQCNFPEAAEYACGWVIQPNSSELTDALDAFFRLSSADISEMSERGRGLVRTRYSWEAVGSQMSAVYDWLMGGPMPDCVEVARQ